MAKVSITLKSNFSFRKLSQNINNIIDDSKLSIAQSIAKNTKKNITGGLSPALSECTLKVRQRGASSFDGHNPSTTTETRPLLYSKRLFDSIKGTKEGLEIMNYGVEHHEGFDTPEKNIGCGSKKRVRPRPFIAKLEDDKEDLEKVQTSLINRIEKTMKK